MGAHPPHFGANFDGAPPPIYTHFDAYDMAATAHMSEAEILSSFFGVHDKYSAFKEWEGLLDSDSDLEPDPGAPGASRRGPPANPDLGAPGVSRRGPPTNPNAGRSAPAPTPAPAAAGQKKKRKKKRGRKKGRPSAPAEGGSAPSPPAPTPCSLCRRTSSQIPYQSVTFPGGKCVRYCGECYDELDLRCDDCHDRHN